MGVLFVDDLTRYRTIRFGRQKSDAFQFLKDYNAWTKNQYGLQVKIFRMDNGTEFGGSQLKMWA